MMGFVTGRMALAAKGLYENLNTNGTADNENNSSVYSMNIQSNQTKNKYKVPDKGPIKSDNSMTKTNTNNNKKK